MAQPFKYERAAAVLVDAAYLGDEAAAKKWKLTTRTIENYRARLKTDSVLSEFFARKRQVAEGNWSTQLRRALGVTLDKAVMIVECVEPLITEVQKDGTTLEVPNIAALDMLIRAGKELGEIALAMEVLNAGNPEQSPGVPASGPNVATGTRLPN